MMRTGGKDAEASASISPEVVAVDAAVVVVVVIVFEPTDFISEETMDGGVATYSFADHSIPRRLNADCNSAGLFKVRQIWV